MLAFPDSWLDGKGGRQSVAVANCLKWTFQFPCKCVHWLPQRKLKKKKSFYFILFLPSPVKRRKRKKEVKNSDFLSQIHWACQNCSKCLYISEPFWYSKVLITNLKTKTELKNFWHEQWIDPNKNIRDITITKAVCRQDSELLGARQTPPQLWGLSGNLWTKSSEELVPELLHLD